MAQATRKAKRRLRWTKDWKAADWKAASSGRDASSDTAAPSLQSCVVARSMRNQRKCNVDSLAKTSERVEVFGKIEGRAPALREWGSEGQRLVSCHWDLA